VKRISYPAPNFDANLEHIVVVILKLTLTHPLALALSQSFVNTFDDFRTIDIDDVHELKYNMTTDPANTPGYKVTRHCRQEDPTYSFLCLFQGRIKGHGLQYSRRMGH
jgi:hypothetical protein